MTLFDRLLEEHSLALHADISILEEELISNIKHHNQSGQPADNEIRLTIIKARTAIVNGLSTLKEKEGKEDVYH